ncbi:class I SAM-dependent methyltransferase [Paraconexibacter antarcticus]|uniref:Class I SAM-dependent methyltransferase n=1 Tax=Paraconexibacter antarcticus TaxID=2949664 RepID=A0ABY5DQJ4_9ACTN|nr:class I SAM-dependent methyltransferase [Paraconexibacter antarcticus]UTI64295.1 class I SAM-dependent methyltransferase [Paraconexibacter antarcticus]
MNANRALWEKGDFTRVAATMRESGEELVRDLGVGPETDVLDVGCGDGTTAIPAAQAGATVLGVDIAANLVAAGNARAQKLGLDRCRFEQGDACELQGATDGRYDLVLSVFGAMFAPHPDDVARELVRVTRPGGRVVMGNWIPGDPTLVAQLLRISSAYAPPPPEGFVSPMAWGQPETVTERFAGAGVSPRDVRCEEATFTFRSPEPPSAVLARFTEYYAPTMNAIAAAAAAGREAELRAELEELFAQQNTSAVGTSIPATYLRVSVQC